MFVGNFEFVINFGQLFSPVLNLFFQRQVFFIYVFYLHHFLTKLFGQSSLLLLALLKLLLGLEKFFIVNTSLLFEFVSSHEFFFHLLQLYRQLFLFFSFVFLFLIDLLPFVLKFISLKLLFGQFFCNFLFFVIKTVLQLFLSLGRNFNSFFDHNGIRREFTFKLLFQTFDLLLILSDHCIFWIFVDFRFVLDSLGLRCITQGADCFLVIVVCWTNVGNHDCFSITS